MGKVVVTGASGLVGRHLVPQLTARGLEVLGTTVHRDVGAYTPLDVSDRAAVRRFFDSLRGVDSVVHLAAIAHRRSWLVGSGAYDRVIHEGTRNVLDAAVVSGVRTFLFFSSSVVYGEMESITGCPEDTPRRPSHPYARSKCAAEDACVEASGRGLHVHILRFPVIYAREWLNGLRARAYMPFTQNCVRMKILELNPEYSLCAIQNTVGAVLHCLETGVAPGVYNVADVRSYTHQEISDVVADLDGKSMEVPVRGKAALRAARIAWRLLPGSMSESVRSASLKLLVGSRLDITKLRRTGFEPLCGLESLKTTDHRVSQLAGCDAR